MVAWAEKLLTTDRDEPVAQGDFLDLVTETMAENQKFLNQRAREAFIEIADLMDDAIVRLTGITGSQSSEEFARYAMSMFSFQILFPKSTAIYLNALTGSLPTCFMELRSILEAFTRCYYADKWFTDTDFFMDRLDQLQTKRRRISRLMRDLKTELGVEFSIVNLWNALSNDWVHTTGFAQTVVDQVTSRSDVPSWAVVVPGYYSEDDLASINELGEAVSLVRELLSSAK